MPLLQGMQEEDLVAMEGSLTWNNNRGRQINSRFLQQQLQSRQSPSAPSPQPRSPDTLHHGYQLPAQKPLRSPSAIQEDMELPPRWHASHPQDGMGTDSGWGLTAMQPQRQRGSAAWQQNPSIQPRHQQGSWQQAAPMQLPNPYMQEYPCDLRGKRMHSQHTQAPHLPREAIYDEEQRWHMPAGWQPQQHRSRMQPAVGDRAHPCTSHPTHPQPMQQPPSHANCMFTPPRHPPRLWALSSQPNESWGTAGRWASAESAGSHPDASFEAQAAARSCSKRAISASPDLLDGSPDFSLPHGLWDGKLPSRPAQGLQSRQQNKVNSQQRWAMTHLELPGGRDARRLPRPNLLGRWNSQQMDARNPKSATVWAEKDGMELPEFQAQLDIDCELVMDSDEYQDNADGCRAGSAPGKGMAKDVLVRRTMAGSFACYDLLTLHLSCSVVCHRKAGWG